MIVHNYLKLKDSSSNWLLVVLFGIGFFCFSHCTNKYQSFDEAERNTQKIDQKNLSLADYLRRIPGLYVTGAGSNVQVRLRENATISGTNSPLYLIDGVKVGHDYARVERMVDPNDIESVKVLTNASETSIYGLEGSKGVILIKTKN